MSATTLFPFEPASMSTAQLAAVSYLARYSGHTHVLYAYQLREWFSWCEVHGLDPLIGVQRAHIELYIRQLGDDSATKWRETRTKPREAFTPGKFVCPHGACFDHEGNIFVVEWVEVGRVSKLRKV